MKTYKETKQAVKDLILEKGIRNVLNLDFNFLAAQGHSCQNIQRAFNYYQYSERTAKYRQ